MPATLHNSRLIRFVLFAGALLHFSIGGAVAAERDCERMLADLSGSHPPADTVREAQRQLTSLGFPVSPIDGVLGPNTRGALILFCERAEFAVGEELVPTLRTHAFLRETHPDWQDTFAGDAFAAWAATQADALDIARVEQSGNHDEVSAVLARFVQSLRRPPRVEAAPTPTETIDSYALTKQDLEQLRSRQAVVVLIAGLQDTTYPSRRELEQAVADLLKETPNPADYVQLVANHAALTEAYTLTRESVDTLRVAGIPDYVVRPLAELKDLRYPMDAEHPGKERLGRAVRGVAEALASRLQLYRSQLAGLVPAAPFRLTETELAGFAPPDGDLLGVAVQEQALRLAQSRTEYRDQAAFGTAVDQALRPLARQIEAGALLATDSAQKTTVYSLDASAIEAIDAHLAALTVPGPMLDDLKEIEGIDYPHADLFWSAVKARLANKGYRGAAPKAEIQDAEQPGAADLEQVLLAEEKPKNGGLPSGTTGPTLDDPEHYRRLIVAQARKPHVFDGARRIEWSGNACGCVHPDLGGEVYGIYPHWLAGSPQVIDFSVLTRVGFHGLTFDDKGALVDPERWEMQDPGFIHEARRHGTKVDLVVYRDDWASWDALRTPEKQAAFHALANNIAAEIGRPIEGLASRMKSYVSLGMSRAPVRGDGVTLYFEGYPADDVSADAFRGFVQELAGLLRKDNHPRALNILFRGTDIGEGIYKYQRLLPTLEAIRGNQSGYSGSYLVLLREPTTYYKKLLRVKLESNLSGEERMKVLRGVTLIVTPGSPQPKQLRDDIIYAYDNFGGIGFWPQAFAEGENTAAMLSIADTLHINFRDQQDTGSEIARNVCRFICPNRWAFHLGLDLLLLAMAATALLFVTHCTWRTWLQNHFIHFIAMIVVPFVLTGMALLFCDPDWDDLSKGNSLLIVLIIAVIAYAIWNHRRHKQRAALP